jgi:hypothetical protein
MISGSQLFHMSSFANALISTVMRHHRTLRGYQTADPFITRKDFPISAWPITLVVLPLIVSSVAYAVCLAIGVN